MSSSGEKREGRKASPSLLIFSAAFFVFIGIAGALGYAAYANSAFFRSAVSELRQSWDNQLQQSALPEQEELRKTIDEESRILSRIEARYQRLQALVLFGIGALAVLLAFGFAAWRLGVRRPLRQLEESCRDLAARNLRGELWGLTRPDMYGGLARSISDFRRCVTELADMSVEGGDGVQLVRFSGRGSAAFNTLIGDLKAQIRALQEDSVAMRLKMEQSADNWQRKADALGDTVLTSSSNLNDIVDASRQQLESLHEGHREVESGARRLVTRFERDMEALKEIAAATGQRVAQTLTVLNASDRDMRRAAQQNLAASETFSTQAADLSGKLAAATTLMRASGKVLSETTEAARSRFMDAVQSVEAQDQALRGFLSETADKTGQIASLYHSISSSAEKVETVVGRFDLRIAEFESRSDQAFTHIAAGSGAMDEMADKLGRAHDFMTGSIETMRDQTDALTRILALIRDDYADGIRKFHEQAAEAGPALAGLKEAGHTIHERIEKDWELYARQSREMLGALEKDVTTMHERTLDVTRNTDQLITSIGEQSRHLHDSAGRFDLQIAAMAQKLENAAGHIVRSNDQVASATAGQVREIHEAVSEMMQRLSLLTQLTGTLGGIAGQLGQVIPSLGDATELLKSGAAAQGLAPDPQLATKIDRLNSDFAQALADMRGEFDGTRGQITRWVETLSGGYQKLAQQINGFDGVLEEKLAALRQGGDGSAPAVVDVDAGEVVRKLAPSLQLIHESLADETTFNRRMIGTVENLRADLNTLRGQIEDTAGNLKGIDGLIEKGFARLGPVESKTAHVPTDEAVAAMNAAIGTLSGMAGDVIRKISNAAGGLQTGQIAAPDAEDLDGLTRQIGKISRELERCADLGAHLAETPQHAADLVQSRLLAEGVMSSIDRLHQIAGSITRMAEPLTGQRKAG